MLQKFFGLSIAAAALGIAAFNAATPAAIAKSVVVQRRGRVSRSYSPSYSRSSPGGARVYLTGSSPAGLRVYWGSANSSFDSSFFGDRRRRRNPCDYRRGRSFDNFGTINYTRTRVQRRRRVRVQLPSSR